MIHVHVAAVKNIKNVAVQTNKNVITGSAKLAFEHKYSYVEL